MRMSRANKNIFRRDAASCCDAALDAIRKVAGRPAHVQRNNSRQGFVYAQHERPSLTRLTDTGDEPLLASRSMESRQLNSGWWSYFDNAFACFQHMRKSS